MAVAFDGTSQYLQIAAPAVTTLPFTIGFWLYVGSEDYKNLWSMGAASADPAWEIWHDPWNNLRLDYWSGSANQGEVLATIGYNEWMYVVGRFISPTNRRLSVLRANGNINHSNSTGSVSPTTLARMTLGAYWSNGSASGFFTGRMAEFWFADADVQPDGAQLDNSMLHQLARRGPLSMPHLQPVLVEYLPLWNGRPDPLYQRGGARAWGGVMPALAPHPPIYADYQGLQWNTRKLLMV